MEVILANTGGILNQYAGAMAIHVKPAGLFLKSFVGM
jgi:hypothetical protein